MPSISSTAIEIEHSLSSHDLFVQALNVARDPNADTDKRLAEGVMALFAASNLSDPTWLAEAHSAVNAIRHARDTNPFDLHRADLIYFASIGDKPHALECASRLVEESRLVRDVQLACKGLRNAAEAFSVFGDLATAQSLLLESRSLSARLEYAAQTVMADIRLADLCTEVLDTEGASSYLASAIQIVEKHSLTTPLIVADLNLQVCWAAMTRGDISTAQRAARAVARHIRGSTPGIGTWSRIGAMLATHRGAETRGLRRDFDMLRASIGSRPFYANEHFSLAALLLYAKERNEFEDASHFVKSQLTRFASSGRPVWPYLEQLIAFR